MYLIIFEDGDMKKAATVSDEDKRSADDGYIDIIDLHAENPTRRVNGEWHDIDAV